MKIVRIGTASVNQTPLDWEGNKRRIVEAIEDLDAKGCHIACFPELAITGYGCEDMFLAPDTTKMAKRMLFEIMDEVTNSMTVAVGLPFRHGNGIYNGVAFFSNNTLHGIAAKQNLASDGVHYESRWFRPWPKGKTFEMETNHGPALVGDVTFKSLEGVRIGFEVCEDAWSAHRPGSNLSDRGVDIILNPSASHFAFGKQEVRRSLVKDSSRAYGTAYAYTNMLGNESGRIVYDGSMLIAAGGELLQESRRFSFKDWETTFADVDIDTLRLGRSKRVSFNPEDENREGEKEFTYVFRSLDPSESPERKPEWLLAKESLEKVIPDSYGMTFHTTKEDEFTRAIALALFDYMRKTWVNGYVVSLSGGADSSAVATLVYYMLKFAKEQLNPEELQAKLPHLDTDNLELKDALTCVYQSTRNSSETTRDAAETLAKDIGSHYMELDVDGLVEAYKDVVGDGLEKDWTWDEDDITLQNIQARSRAPSVWMISNTKNQILLATSNRSEAAVGYATMDGDTCGGLSPIAGIDKAFLRQWLCHVEMEVALCKVNEQQPTAELRPQSEDQTDEGDLMPYPVLDFIEDLAIRDKKGPKDVFAFVKAKFDQKDSVTYAQIEKFFQLWCRNQWKRERYAPSFHVDDKNLDPRSWCRFPILSGGFKLELRELKESIKESK